jgi:hypothetical protein
VLTLLTRFPCDTGVETNNPTRNGAHPMMKRHRLTDVLAEMDRIKREGHDKLRDDDEIAELAFFRLLRSAFTEFLETQPWVKSVGSDYWPGSDSEEARFGLRFMINVDHAHLEDLEVVIKRGPN